ncbi:MAG: Cobalt transport protein [Candidatus Methanofastidiosum methylothiophilum]|uniref:Cobalt transport protein n=1 Tax=Candidatus Methanofastidiosum methylothiophilum TaxID=1705564 RepID=A0A150IHG6_9EURY|nr:MAG: Cobalt transport protein [Candidatus Methanofastidiosum methylthiophilus]KYC47438.1 MAG: Cobalt transport protein [Candidatus Methanofastidiosum methylthiophilus]KYC49997.1 MAG: Cobalt transport protein [Candidatus Methanofastidiosum methylthiophilus]
MKYEPVEALLKSASQYFEVFFIQENVKGPIRLVDTRIGLIGFLILVLLSISTFSPPKLFFIFFNLLLLIVVSNIPIRTYLKRVGLIPLFIFTIMLPQIFISSFEYAILFTFRVCLAVSFLIIFTLITPFKEILTSLRFYKIPEILVLTLSFTYSYTYLVFNELYRILIARESRRFNNKSYRKIWHEGGELLGMFFIKVYERGENIHLARISRGYSNMPYSVKFIKFNLMPNIIFISFIASVTVGWMVL